MAERPYIAIAIPSWYGLTSLEFALSFRRLLIPFDHFIINSVGMEISNARNKLVEQALDEGATHIFFLDDDILLPSNTLIFLYSARYPIVSGLYVSKKMKWCVFMKQNNEFVPLEKIPKHPIVVDAVGLGCCLIESKVFEIVDKPWFKWEKRGDKTIGEDFYFFEKAEKYGFKPLVLPYVKCYHVSKVLLSEPGKIRIGTKNVFV